jgi:hypothetical protein
MAVRECDQIDPLGLLLDSGHFGFSSQGSMLDAFASGRVEPEGRVTEPGQ